jgi:hypothetical protein
MSTLPVVTDLDKPGRVWSCVPCGTIYGQHHDPHTRCVVCHECCYQFVATVSALDRRDRLEAKRLRIMHGESA